MTTFLISSVFVVALLALLIWYGNRIPAGHCQCRHAESFHEARADGTCRHPAAKDRTGPDGLCACQRFIPAHRAGR